MIYFLSFWSDIGFAIKQALRTFSCNIAAVLYGFIVDLYNVFMYTARAEVLESSFIQGIYIKVGMILGIFMIFKLSFSLIQSLVDPNKFTDQKTGFGGIIMRSVISIVLLGITPSIFRMAFDLQDLIVGSANNTDNIIYKIIVGSSPSNDAESFGHIIASELYFGFYTENEPLKLNQGLELIYPDSDDDGSGGVKLVVHDYAYLKTAVESGAMSFKDTVDYLSITSSGQYVINWDGLFAIGFAIFMIWILISYCIQVATRVMQLAYLQLVAPVPILSYISDPDGAFKNWTKQCLTTYLDLFIRLAIIYFIITVSTQILEAVKNSESVLFSSTGLDPESSTIFWVKIFLIMGLLMFGKRVPDLLKDLFPNIGGGAASLGFGPTKPKDVPGYGFAKGAVTFGAGAAIGGIAGMASGIRNGYGVKGKIAGAFGGFNRGLAGGAKTKGNVVKNVQGGMSSARQARQRALDRQVYKIDNAKITKEYQDNEAIIAAKKAIDDRAESQLLKTDAGVQAAQARLNYIESNVGKRDASTGRIITTADVVAQKAAYKTYMDTKKTTWVNANASTDTEIAKQMQEIQNKTGTKTNNYTDVDTAATRAKASNVRNARTVSENDAKKQKMQQKKSKIK